MDCFPQDRKIEGVINLEMDHEREDEIIKREMFGKERVPVTDKDSRWNGKDQAHRQERKINRLPDGHTTKKTARPTESSFGNRRRAQA